MSELQSFLKRFVSGSNIYHKLVITWRLKVSILDDVIHAFLKKTYEFLEMLLVLPMHVRPLGYARTAFLQIRLQHRPRIEFFFHHFKRIVVRVTVGIIVHLDNVCNAIRRNKRMAVIYNYNVLHIKSNIIVMRPGAIVRLKNKSLYIYFI